jgi:hypothetical protein
MVRPALAAVVCIAGFTAACGLFFEPKPDVAKPKTASVAGLQVSYPGNWKTELETADEDGVAISTLTIESSGSAIAIVQVFEPAIDLGADEIYDIYLTEMVSATQATAGGIAKLSRDGAPTPFTRTVLGQPAEGRAGGHTITLFGERVPHKIETLHQDLDDRSVIVVVQAPSEDWARAEPGFALIYDSLARE